VSSRFDERANAGPEHLDPEYVAGYDVKAGFDVETHVRREHSTFDWLLEPMLQRAGFEIRDAWHAPSRTYSHYARVKH
jgi:hypothetical protein